MRRICSFALTTAAVLALPAGAQAASAALDRGCYVSGQDGTLALSGYAPNAAVTVSNKELGAVQVTTDATGQATQDFTPPSGNDLKLPGSRAFVITATEVANPASTSTASSRVAPFAFATDAGTKSPKATRSWYFSGFAPGKSIYGHFRFRATTRGTYRFGVAQGACGVRKRRAPGIAIPGRVSPGLWTIQIDQVKQYRATTRPQLKDTFVVYTRYSRRQALGAAALSAAALSGRHPFLPFAAWR